VRLGPLILAVLLATTGAGAMVSRESPEQLFSAANTLYRQGDYSSAEAAYRGVLSHGIQSATLFYNLGNACFKQKKLGEAIYFYEKARRQLPGDRDIEENLELANLLIVDRVEIPPDPLPIRLLDRLVHILTIEQESWLALFLFASLNGFMILYHLASGRRTRLAGLVASLSAGTLLLLCLASTGAKLYEARYKQEAVIIAEKVDVRSAPAVQNITVFTVHEGTKVRIRARTEGWYQVSLPNGWTGWLESSTLRTL